MDETAYSGEDAVNLITAGHSALRRGLEPAELERRHALPVASLSHRIRDAAGHG